ncbi:MAG: hypothetical protein WAT92_00995 [Saprospiraceae bacterium]
MTKTEALKGFINDEQILEVLIKFETRKLDACGLLQEYMFPKWQITKLEAMQMILDVQKEFQSVAVGGKKK